LGEGKNEKRGPVKEIALGPSGLKGCRAWGKGQTHPKGWGGARNQKKKTKKRPKNHSG